MRNNSKEVGDNNKKRLLETTREELELWHKTMVTPFIKRKLENKKNKKVKEQIKERLLKGDLGKLYGIISQEQSPRKESKSSLILLNDCIKVMQTINKEIKRLDRVNNRKELK